ncbi:MAG: hypothetical protein FJ291_19165 [Planctomycetes bacterium]|nr:hypothetical protein [Planctomycetota bacterium]
MSDELNEKAFEENLSRLLRRGGALPKLDPQRRAAMLVALKARQAKAPMRRLVRLAVAAAAAMALALGGWLLFGSKPAPVRVVTPTNWATAPTGEGVFGEAMIKALPDGSVLIVRRGARFAEEGQRRLRLDSGELYLIVAKAPTPFVVATPQGRAEAMGTRFAVATDEGTRVAVAQGVVKLSSERGEVEVSAGEEGVVRTGESPRRGPAPRLSHLVSWAREALSQKERLVSRERHETGELIAIDPWGQEMRLTLRKYHVDIHIENGIARTTVDQTFFNHVPWQIEGTFYFPLPPDASVSRLAMYVSGSLNEGGMVERSRGQQIYTEIKLQRRDPALLEMMEGNVFKMRIFPIEGRQEKRIFLSYTQQLPELYGTLRYWFPMDHTHDKARELTIHTRIKGGAHKFEPRSSTHPLAVTEDRDDIVLDYKASDVKPDQDFLLHLVPGKAASREGFATTGKDGLRYVFARVAPSLPGRMQVKPRQWVVINDVSGSRTKLDIQAQAYILDRLLREADDFDRVALINTNTGAAVVEPGFVGVHDPAARRLVEAARVDLPLGATNLAAALQVAAEAMVTAKATNPHILYLGDGVATDGQTSIEELLKLLPSGATFIGIGVGKKADATFLQAAGDQTGGLFTHINPDEDIDWRAFDLVASLNTPRLADVSVEFLDASGKPCDVAAYPSARALADGETLCVVGRTAGALPATMLLRGRLGGKPFERRYPLAGASSDGEFIPRLWAKRHIDELLKGGEKHKPEIVALSKQYYVMTPYTSLIVLENDAMYSQYNVERGRKDHWALYPAPKTIPVVTEPLGGGERPALSTAPPPDEKPSKLREIVGKLQFGAAPRFYRWRTQTHGLARYALYELLDSGRAPAGLLAGLIEGASKAPRGAQPRARRLPPERIDLVRSSGEIVPVEDMVPATLEEAAALDLLKRYQMQWRVQADQNRFIAEQHAKAGDAHLQNGAYDDALRQYERALQLDLGNKAAEEGRRKAESLLGVTRPRFADLAADYARQRSIALEVQRGINWSAAERPVLRMFDPANLIVDNWSMLTLLVDKSRSMSRFEDGDTWLWGGTPTVNGVSPGGDLWGTTGGSYDWFDVDGDSFSLRLRDPEAFEPFSVRWERANGTLRVPVLWHGQAGQIMDSGGSLVVTDSGLVAEPPVGLPWSTSGGGVPALPVGTMAPLKLVLPLPMFRGTAKNIQLTPQMEKPSARPRPPFVAPAGTRLLSRGKPVASSDDAPIIGELAQVTDGDKRGSDGSYVELGPGRQWVQIDLGRSFALHAIVAWRFHGEARFYHDAIVQVSDDRDFITGVSTLFNNDHDNSSGLGVGRDLEYLETYEGRLVDAKGAEGRYVRLYSRGNTSNDMNHYTEVEVYGKEPGGALARPVRSALFDAMRSVAGTSAVAAADLLAGRKAELLARERTDDEEQELAAIKSALAKLAAAYPLLDDTSAFWGGGWDQRPQPWAFQPPEVTAYPYPYHRWSHCLAAYAPGLYNTQLDILELLDKDTAPAGKASREAEEAIARAREAVRPVKVRLGKGKPEVLVGPGDRFAFERATSMRLKERVVCDGESVYHLYGELGLAARRGSTGETPVPPTPVPPTPVPPTPVPPRWRAELRQLAPHLVEPAEWLARRYDVALAERRPGRFTLRLTPVGGTGLRPVSPTGGTPVPPEGGGVIGGTGLRPVTPTGKMPVPPAPRAAAHILLTVGNDGRIAEKALVVGDKVSLKLAFAYDGPTVTARWLDGDGKELAKGTFQAEPFTPDATTFRPDLEPFAVIDMPLRRPSDYEPHAREAWARKDTLEAARHERHFALARLQAYSASDEDKVARDRIAAAMNAIVQDGGRGKLGDLALLGSCGYHRDVADWARKLGVPESQPLVAFYTHYLDQVALAKVRDAHPASLVGHVAAYLAALPSFGRSKELDTFLANYSDSPLAFAAVWYSDGESKWARLFGHPTWGVAAVRMAALGAHTAAQQKPVAEAFARLHEELSAKGIELPLDASVATSLKSVDGGKPWARVVRSAEGLAEASGLAGPLLRLGEAALLRGDAATARSLFARVGSARDDCPLLAQFAVAQATWAGGAPIDALPLFEALLAELERRGVAASPALLASAARVAEQAGESDRAADLEQRALATEQDHLPDQLNVHAFRQRYEWLWGRYHAEATAAIAAKDKKRLERALAGAERTWNHWRQVDRDYPQMVEAMAHLQMAAGRREAAWLYLSSVMDEKPKDAATYQLLAAWFRGRGEREAAQGWLARAFECDTANPQWLFERAQVLDQIGRRAEAEKLYRQIIEGQWAQGLQSYVGRARAEMRGR